MATRQETQNKREVMRGAILESCSSGQARRGDVIPPLRKLAFQYNLSINQVAEVIRGLVDEGVLHARQGAGTFVGSPSPASLGAFLFLLPEGVGFSFLAANFGGLVQRAFESHIAQLGGSCLALTYEDAKEYSRRGDLPPLSGIFSIDAKTANASWLDLQVPRAWFSDEISTVASGPKHSPEPDGGAVGDTSGDTIHFNDHDGGRQATQHLFALGHRSIAFLALHNPADPDVFHWSAEREAGWQEKMLQLNASAKPLSFHPLRTHRVRPDEEVPEAHGNEQLRAAREATASLPFLIQHREVTAVVAANIFAARGLFEVLEKAQVPAELWPAVVCFDSFDDMDNHVVSALNLPWDGIGKAGAQVLAERKTGALQGTGRLRLVSMRLIPRLTCVPIGHRRDWAHSQATKSGVALPHRAPHFLETTGV